MTKSTQQKSTRTTTKSATVSREAFERAVSDIYRERARLAELRETTVSRERFDRAIADIRRLRSELAEAYATGAAAVLNSTVINEYLPREVRQNLRPGRFASQARRTASRQR